jgi:hypothetical protein
LGFRNLGITESQKLRTTNQRKEEEKQKQMVSVKDLPVEIILLILSCLLSSRTFSNEVKKWFSDERFHCMDDFAEQETKWSWRNFLSMANSTETKVMRKSAMLWDLNHLKSNDFLNDQSFRVYLTSRMIDQARQVSCRLYQLRTGSKPMIEHICDVWFVGTLHISEYTGIAFPCCPYLHTLSFYECENLVSIGDCENLKGLKIINCKHLEEVGKMDSLVSVCIRTYPRQNTTLFNHFPLEQLEELCCEGCRLEILTLVLPRLITMRSLTFTVNPDLDKNAVASFSNNSLLRKLVLHGFKTVFLTGLTELAVLDTDFADVVIGKETIFPQLMSLSASGQILNREDFRSFPKLKCLSMVDTFENYNVTTVSPQLHSLTRIPAFSYSVKDLHRCLSLFDLCFPDPIMINPQAKSVEINFPTNEIMGVVDAPVLHQLKLQNYFSTSLSVFVNIEKLYLFDCPMVDDIHCLHRVRYLWIRNCVGIQDFSCLGSQTFLVIDNGENLLDEQMNNFGNIACLRLMNCHNIKKLLLENHRHVWLSCCSSLQEIQFLGRDFLKVDILSCCFLRRCIISGRIYYLFVGKHCSAKLQGIENCTYFFNAK